MRHRKSRRSRLIVPFRWCNLPIRSHHHTRPTRNEGETMNLSALLALAPIALKYGPLIFHFLETQGPGVQAFFKEVEAALQASKKPDGSLDWTALIPIAMKYGPTAVTFMQTQGVQIEHFVSDIMAAV